MARLTAGDEVEGIDEEFLYHLNRGSDLLARGDAEPATLSLERALALRPKDAKVLGLLGKAFYKLTRYDDATIAWQRLVDDNPVEPAARVNLGLAFLKAKRYPQATKQLEIALDLNPDHKKAMAYLGLALFEAGAPAKARDWFRKAGSDQMVARCDEVLASGAPARRAADEDEAEAVAEAAVEPAETPPPAPEPLATPAPAADAAVVPTAAPAAVAPISAAGAVPLAGWAAARLVQPPVAGSFSVEPGGVLAAAVRGELRIRLDGLFATRGRLEVAPELKRFRGRPTEKPFGDGAGRMVHVRGDGALLFRAAGRRFTALELGPDAVYLRDEALFGFEDGIAFENGRVPSSNGAELDLVHLRGRGCFLLVTAGDPVALDAGPDAPVRVPLRALVGWVGALTPRTIALVEDGGDGAADAVELVGEGRVLVDPGAVLGAPA